MNGTIKRIEPVEADAILPLIHQTTRESYAACYPREAIDFFIQYHSAENVRRDIANGYAVVIGQQETVVGTGTLLGSEIRRVFVLPAFQGFGYGGAIMDHLEQVARQLGLPAVELDASLAAKRFYDRRGYRTLEAASIAVANSRSLDYFRMAKTIVAHGDETRRPS